jgi:hypothetical protein
MIPTMFPFFQVSVNNDVRKDTNVGLREAVNRMGESVPSEKCAR